MVFLVGSALAKVLPLNFSEKIKSCPDLSRFSVIKWYCEKFFHSISPRSVWTQALCFYLKMEAMLIQKSCKYCGRIHAEGYICSKKPLKRKKIDDAVRFRNSSEWNRKRLEIRARDNYLCQICIRELYGTRRKYNCEDLQVHHVVPINENETLRLDNSNLITLCSMHHAMCDRGEIPYDEVKEIIKQQEQSPPAVN